MKLIRTRFAPSPTGIMHIGNVRAALMNYLFAQRNNGIFILRIEDTDAQRNIDQGTQFILSHLAWLGLHYQEGPNIGGVHAPYFQSQRSETYKKHLNNLQQADMVYRCFCTADELEVRRNRQIAMKKPPMYDRTCLKLSAQQIDEKLAQKTPFIWRMKVDSTKKISFKDLARGVLEFDLQHFSDFPLTREDESFTFIFANCIDDIEMEITHVFRGEEHLSNTVSQSVLYQALGQQLPMFWHLPILFNQEGKKLSKRDKGFSLEDLKMQGYLPEAICNYLGILSCSFEQEIMNLEQLAAAYKFDNLHGVSQIKYDVEKLRWINHKWISSYDINQLMQLCKPILTQYYDLSTISDTTLTTLLSAIKTDMQTLQDCVILLAFYFKRPEIHPAAYTEILDTPTFNKVHAIIKQQKTTQDWPAFLNHVKGEIKTAGIPDKALYATLRTLLTGIPKGMQLQDIFNCLGADEFFARLHQ